MVCAQAVFEYVLEVDSLNSETTCFGFTLGAPANSSYSSSEKLMYRWVVALVDLTCPRP